MLQSRIPRLAIMTLLGTPDGIDAGDASARLFEHMLSEVHAQAVGVAVVTTAANSLSDWRFRIVPSDIARFAPAGATLRALLPVLENNTAVPEHVFGELRTFIAEIEAARAALECFIDDCNAISPDRAASVHARLLQSIWRPLCGDARQLVLQLERDAPASLPDLYTQNTRVVSALLAGAANGLRPCLDSDGYLYIPPLPQRRRAPRRTILQNCTIHSEALTQSAFVRDASVGGLGLTRVSRLKRGERIRVELTSGRQLHGTVAWSSGGSAGIRFDVPLPVDDSLLAL